MPLFVISRVHLSRKPGFSLKSFLFHLLSLILYLYSFVFILLSYVFVSFCSEFDTCNNEVGVKWREAEKRWLGKGWGVHNEQVQRLVGQGCTLRPHSLHHCTLGQNQVILRHQKFTFPWAREWAKWASKQMSERSGRREQSEQSGASKQVSGASERANGRASGPVPQSVFLVILAHSGLALLVNAILTLCLEKCFWKG